MAKGYVLIDKIPETCIDCRFCREISEGIEAYCELENSPEDDELIREIDVSYPQDKPNWCPIHKLPNRKQPEKFTISPLIKEQYTEFNRGWNACLDEILNKNRE